MESVNVYWWFCVESKCFIIIMIWYNSGEFGIIRDKREYKCIEYSFEVLSFGSLSPSPWFSFYRCWGVDRNYDMVCGEDQVPWRSSLMCRSSLHLVWPCQLGMDYILSLGWVGLYSKLGMGLQPSWANIETPRPINI